ncbi:MAG TPA: serine hydrolase [Saprospiraceae bacterium]|nr:serine hydrolase [Saprospiraceae bacterium]
MIIKVFIVFTALGCVDRPIPDAVNSIDSLKIPLNESQIELIYGKSKIFPENTQLALGVIRGGKVDFVGIQRVNDTIFPIDNHKNIFEIGSITKVFNATLLAHMAAEGKLDLNSPIQDVLDLELAVDNEITFKQLANHTSGLPRLPSNMNFLFSDPKNPYKNYDSIKLHEYLANKMELKSTPGETYEYSNLGAGLLGELLSELSNSTYEDLLQQYIFSEYGMYSSTTDRSKFESGFVFGLDGQGKETPFWDFQVLKGLGAMLSTVDDLSRFALAQFNDNNEVIRLTQKPTFTLNDQTKIGLGWHILTMSNGIEVIWHNGGTGGFTSSMALDLVLKNGVIILSNVSAYHKDSKNIDALCFELIKTLVNEE